MNWDDFTHHAGHQVHPPQQVMKARVVAEGVPDWDGYAAALINFRFIANDVLTTSEAVKAMDEAGKTITN